MKKFLEKLIANKKQELKEKEARMKESQDIEEVRSLGETLTKLRDEINDAEEELKKVKDDDKEDEKDNNDNGNNDDGSRSNKNNSANEGRSANGFDPNAMLGLQPIESYTMKQREKNLQVEGKRSSIEYRTAFKNYVQTGKVDREILQFSQRADAAGTSADLGVLIPETIIQEIIQDVQGVYGQLYSRVRKTNVAGGVKYPIGDFDAKFTRIKEDGTSDRQKVTGITGSIVFTYKTGEIRLARTLLQTILSVEVFEKEFANTIAKAYVRAMDKEIMNGDGDTECTGILTEAKKQTGSRIKAAHIIEFTAEEMKNWKKWQEKLFAKIPLAMRGLNPEFVMTSNTYEANIKTLSDDNNRPVYNETYNPVDGAEISKFKGKNVVFTEEDVLKNFNDASDGEFFGMYWVPEMAYAINSNLEFIVVDYFDQEKNQYVKKALVINDGQVLNPDYIYLLKKKVTA